MSGTSTYSSMHIFLYYIFLCIYSSKSMCPTVYITYFLRSLGPQLLRTFSTSSPHLPNMSTSANYAKFSKLPNIRRYNTGCKIHKQCKLDFETIQSCAYTKPVCHLLVGRYFNIDKQYAINVPLSNHLQSSTESVTYSLVTILYRISCNPPYRTLKLISSSLLIQPLHS